MPPSKSPLLLSGTCQHFLFSPKGSIEGVLLDVKGVTVQVSMPPDIGMALTQKTAPGKKLRVLALLDRSPKTAGSTHPVYTFEALANAAGEVIMWPTDGEGITKMQGRVARLHFAKHGEPNGVVLESGEYIHLRPHGMAAIVVEVGAKVTAKGLLRMTVLGTRMLEAHHANGHDIE